MRRVILLAAISAVALFAVPTMARASPISTSEAKRVMKRYINQQYGVALGPYFGACQRLAVNKVRCEVEFKAGIFWRAGRVSVRDSGSYYHIDANLPIE